MLAKILDGKKHAKDLLDIIKNEILHRKSMGIPNPVLAVILVGDDIRSTIYVKNKLLACEQVGIICRFFHLSKDIPEQEVLELICNLNRNKEVNGILVQLPLPKHINTEKVVCSIDPQKDVDGFHPQNFGLLAQGWPILQPCTPMGIMRLLYITKTNLTGKIATIVGSSNIVGKPMAFCLINSGCTVVMCNKNTLDLHSYIRNTDLLIAAAGKPNLIKGDWIKKGSIVIDVGINIVNNKVIGDVEFSIAKLHAGWITKVPGGVGPMTIACLLENTLLSQKLQF